MIKSKIRDLELSLGVPGAECRCASFMFSPIWTNIGSPERFRVKINDFSQKSTFFQNIVCFIFSKSHFLANKNRRRHNVDTSRVVRFQKNHENQPGRARQKRLRAETSGTRSQTTQDAYKHPHVASPIYVRF